MTEDRDISLEWLVTRCQRGDRDAFEELIRGWERRLFVYVRKLVTDEEAAWQVLQDVWLRVLRGVARLQDPRRFRTWVYQITRRAAMDHLRQRYAQVGPLDDDATPAVDDDSLQKFDDAERVHHAMTGLPLASREVLTLFFLNDLTIGETAEVLGIPPGTVKSRLHQAKRALRQALDAEGGPHASP